MRGLPVATNLAAVTVAKAKVKAKAKAALPNESAVN